MKYILLIISIVILVYSVYLITVCFTAGGLTEFGKGIFVGGILMFISGGLLFGFSIKKIRRHKK